MIDNHQRIQIIGVLFAVAAAVVLLRLGYLQIVRHDYFSVLASQSHSRKFEIAPQRGQIYLYDRGNPVPVAMNRNLKTLYADTRYIFNHEHVISGLKEVLGVDYSDKIASADGYVMLEKEVPLNQAIQIEQLDVSGIGLSDNYRRVYPEGSLASQTIGFVNADGAGQYGIEEFLDNKLRGKAGMFDIETDASGIPIATSDNIQVQPQSGNDVYMTIDRNIQARVESVLKDHVEKTSARSAHAIVMESHSGRVVAMGNYPTFDPNEYGEVKDYSLFTNPVVSDVFEPGSGFKVFTMAAALDLGAVSAGDTFTDTGSVRVDDALIRNVGGSGPGVRSMTDIIVESINTGVVHVLSRLGGGEINMQAKNALYSFFSDNLQLATPTGIEQPAEPELSINSPEGPGRVNYANMTFGQGIVTTMMRMTTSMAAVINGGVLYQPHLVDYQVTSEGRVIETKPKAVARDVVSEKTSKEIREMMAVSVQEGGGWAITRLIPDHEVGGKTGTAEIAAPGGGYLKDQYIGSFIGFAPVDDPQYVLMVRIDDPRVAGYAGSSGAGPVFADIIEWLVRYAGIPAS